MARYTHRVAISNHRIVNFADGQVTFRWKNYAHKSKQRVVTVTAEEFLRRAPHLASPLCPYPLLRLPSEPATRRNYCRSAGDCRGRLRS